MNIAVISNKDVPDLVSVKHTLFQECLQTDDNNLLNEIIKYCQTNKCDAFIIYNPAFDKRIIDIIGDDEYLMNPDIGYIYSDYCVSGIPVLNTSSKIITSLPVILIKVEHMLMFQNLENLLKNCIGKHIAEVSLYA